MTKFQSPVDNSWVTDGHKDGSALDLGWLSKLNNKHQNIYAIGNGTVLSNTYYSDSGNMVVIAHDYNATHDMWTGYAHLQNKGIVDVGARVKQGDKIGNMGATGISRGEHLHVRMALVPKGTKYLLSTYNRYKRLDPAKYLYEYPHQNVDGLPKLPTDKPKEETNKKLTDKEIAHQILYGDNIWGNGQARKDSLGSRWRSVQNIIEAELAKDNKPKPPVQKPTPSKPKTLVGTKFTFKGGTKIYNDNPKPTLYTDQPTQNYSATVIEDKGEWLKIRVKEFNPTDVWIYKKDSGLRGGTTSTPSKPKVERVTVSGNHYLYSSHTGNDIYGSGRQNLKSRNMEVLERRNGRVRVNAKPYFKTVNGKQVPVFDVDSFWVKL